MHCELKVLGVQKLLSLNLFFFFFRFLALAGRVFGIDGV